MRQLKRYRSSSWGGELNRHRGGTKNLDAYLLYLRGVAATLRNTKASLDAASEFLDQAISLDPNFGLAISQLAFAMVVATDNNFLRPTVGYERARLLAQRALESSPDLATAHAVLQYVQRTLDWDWVAAEAEGQRALAIDPTNSGALLAAGILSYTLGRWDDAEQYLSSALVRDPLNAFVLWNLGTAYYFSGRLKDAEATYRRLLAIAPEFLWTRSFLAKTLLVDGRPDEALVIVQQEVDEAHRMLFLPSILTALGRHSEADEALGVQIKDNEASYYVALNYAYRGDTDLALLWLERAYDNKHHGLTQMVGEPLFNKVADDPRYKAFLQKMGLPSR